MRTHLLLLFTVICFHLTAEPSPITIQVDVAHEKRVDEAHLGLVWVR